MNDPIIIPRTHLILDAAILTAISAGPTRGWNNADVETAEERDESLLYFPGITPKLALFTLTS